jgi:hypothetical protein
MGSGYTSDQVHLLRVVFMQLNVDLISERNKKMQTMNKIPINTLPTSTSAYIHIPFCEHICYYCDSTIRIRFITISFLKISYNKYTFAILSAEKNILRALKNNFRVTIFYVYQDPQTAWDFTRKREVAEGLHVPKKIFINAFFKSRENIEKIKERHPEVVLHIMIKDYQNNVSEVYYAADNIRLVLPVRYTSEESGENLYD